TRKRSLCDAGYYLGASKHRRILIPERNASGARRAGISFRCARLDFQSADRAVGLLDFQTRKQGSPSVRPGEGADFVDAFPANPGRKNKRGYVGGAIRFERPIFRSAAGSPGARRAQRAAAAWRSSPGKPQTIARLYGESRAAASFNRSEFHLRGEDAEPGRAAEFRARACAASEAPLASAESSGQPSRRLRENCGRPLCESRATSLLLALRPLQEISRGAESAAEKRRGGPARKGRSR